MTKTNDELLPTLVTEKIDHWLKKYPADQRRSALLPALMITQEFNGGYLTNPLIEAVAHYLEIPEIAAYEVATFYSMYDLSPVGKHKINVCTNISCQLRGSDDIMTHLKKRLNVEVGGTSSDGKFTLKSVECLAACVNAPMMQIDKTCYHDLTVEKVNEILASYEEQKSDNS